MEKSNQILFLQGLGYISKYLGYSIFKTMPQLEKEGAPDKEKLWAGLLLLYLFTFLWEGGELLSKYNIVFLF